MIVSQDLQDAADVLDMLRGIGCEDYDIIEDADRNYIKALSENIVHKILKHSSGISGALRTDCVFIKPFATAKCSLPFIPLLNPNLMISIS